jgi:hypothetical protein
VVTMARRTIEVRKSRNIGDAIVSGVRRAASRRRS